MNFKSLCKFRAPSIAIMVGVIVAISSNNSHGSTIKETKTTHVVDTANLGVPLNYQVGSLYVQQIGNSKNGAAPLILIPGLSSGGYVWDQTVQRLKDKHTLYVITLAGFNGTAAIDGPKMAKAKDSLRELIISKGINKPILVGHSLGATLSIWFSETNSDLVRGVFAVDGLAVLPRSEGMNLEQRKAMADGMKKQMLGQSQEVFAAQQLKYMNTIGVIDGETAKKLGELSGKSDPDAVTEYMTEIFAMDLRKDLAAIKVPFTIISPYYATDMLAYGISEQQKTEYYAGLHEGAAQLKVVSINNSRHFPMYDQPEIFAEKLQSFVDEVK